MAIKYLGETVDIHSGGSDLIFPHHENEIAQAEAATGKPFVRFWIHNGYLLIDQEKMSKSLGNFLTAREARKRFHPLAIRLFMLSAHYRSPINFSEEALVQAAAGVERLRNCWRDLRENMTTREGRTSPDETLRKTVRIAEEQFRKELDDDFNTAGALGVVFSVVKTVNTHLKEHTAVDVEGLAEAERFFRIVEDIMGVLGIDDMERPSENDAAIDALVAERRDARQRKDFARADAIRAELEKKGIILEDTSEGTRWKRKLS
jgi:cysteinyl-tRNA synthetase